MNLAIITNKPFETCETFIKAQIERLPFKVFHYHGNRVPFNLRIKTLTFFEKILVKLRLLKQKCPNKILVKEFQQKKIQVVLAQYGTVGAEVLPVCKQLSLPLVVHFHGHDAVRTTVIQRYQKAYQDMFLYPKTTVVSVSHEMTNRLIKLGCPREKIAYNTYGPHPKFFQVRPTFSKLQYLSVGRFVDKKAPHLTLLAFKKAVGQYPEAHLVYAGDGILRSSCFDLVKALGIEKQVTMPGRISPDVYRDYLKESLAYIQHSIEAQDGDMEGTPVSILEASAAGLPVISTYHAGIPDVIVHKKTGLLCKEHDIDAMAGHMIALLEEPKMAQILGAEGKHRIQKQFSMEQHIQGLTSIIKSAVKREL